MPPIVVAGAMGACSFGGPGNLLALPTRRMLVEGRPPLTVADTTPVNMPTFGMCMSLGNPTVASATSLAGGVLVPQPCVPVITGPWKPGALKAMVGGIPLLTAGSACNCAYGGVVSVVQPGSKVMAS